MPPRSPPLPVVLVAVGVGLGEAPEEQKIFTVLPLAAEALPPGSVLMTFPLCTSLLYWLMIWVWKPAFWMVPAACVQLWPRTGGTAVLPGPLETTTVSCVVIGSTWPASDLPLPSCRSITLPAGTVLLAWSFSCRLVKPAELRVCSTVALVLLFSDAVSGSFFC